MRCLSLAPVLSAATLLASTASAKPQLKNYMFRDFVYPSRDKAHTLSDNQVDLGYEVHEGVPSVLLSDFPDLTETSLISRQTGK